MTQRDQERVFLDANILFSAAYREDSGLRRLWSRRDCLLMTSGYAREEARRNLDSEAQLRRLDDLLRNIEVVPEASATPGFAEWELPEKDVPILAAAIMAGATHLITGDVHHFRHLFGKSVSGVLILRPATFLRS